MVLQISIRIETVRVVLLGFKMLEKVGCILRSERNSGNYSGDGTSLVGAADQCILGFVMFSREMLVVTLGMKLTWLMMMKVLLRGGRNMAEGQRQLPNTNERLGLARIRIHVSTLTPDPN